MPELGGWLARRSAEIDEPAARRGMHAGKRAADPQPQAPGVLRLQVGVMDDARILAAGEAGAAALAGKAQRLAHALANRPARLAGLLREQREVLDVLLAPPISLQTDRRDERVGACVDGR